MAAGTPLPSSDVKPGKASVSSDSYRAAREAAVHASDDVNVDGDDHGSQQSLLREWIRTVSPPVLLSLRSRCVKLRMVTLGARFRTEVGAVSPSSTSSPELSSPSQLHSGRELDVDPSLQSYALPYHEVRRKTRPAMPHPLFTPRPRRIGWRARNSTPFVVVFPTVKGSFALNIGWCGGATR